MKSDLNSVKLMNLNQRQSTSERTKAKFFIQKKAKHESACTGFTGALREAAALNCIKREREEEGSHKSLSSPVATGPLLVRGAVEHGLMSPPSLHSSVTRYHLVHCHHEHGNTGWPTPAHPPAPTASAPQVSGHSSRCCAIYLFHAAGRWLGPRPPFMGVRKK